MTENSPEVVAKPTTTDQKSTTSAKKNFNIDVAHISMQFNDSRVLATEDAEKIFSRGYRWITGTEGSGPRVMPALLLASHNHGYKIAIGQGNWVAVKRDVIRPGSYKSDNDTIVDESLVHHLGGALNVEYVQYEDKDLGFVTIMASHYSTKGRPTKNPEYNKNLKWNKKLAKGITDRAEEFGAGKAIVFYGGDQNIVDKKDDTFFGGPMTSVWDELGKHDNTGHGNIDVVATYDQDGRVKATYARALDDTKLKLNTDHYLVEVGFSVRSL